MSPMVSTKTFPLATASELREIAGGEGPFLTLLIPDRHPGAPEAPRATLVRGMARLAGEQAGAQKLDVAGLVAPLEEFASVFESDPGGPGVALFRSPTVLTALTAPGIRESSVTLSRHPNLSPLIVLASVPQKFYILGLSRKALHLYRYDQGACESVDLPTEVPPSLELALNFDFESDHRQLNRAGAGQASFGTATDREKASEHQYNWFVQVDRALRPILKDTPLLLAGVNEELAAYRRAAKGDHLLTQDIQGNIDFLSPAEIAVRASEAALAHYRGVGEAVLAKYREMPNRKRTRGTVRTVLSMAIAGRVHQLCAAEGCVIRGSLKRHGGFEKEDLVNAAIVETLRHGGEVFMLPLDRMPEGVPVAAILRF